MMELIKFSSLQIDEQKTLIEQNTSLLEEYKEFLVEQETSLINNKLSVFEDNCVDYNFGFNEDDKCYFKVKNNDLFIKGIKKFEEEYTLDGYCLRQYKSVLKYKDNKKIFEKSINNLAKGFFQDEIMDIVEFAMDAIFEINEETIGSSAIYYLQNFINTKMLNYFCDSKNHNEMYKKASN